MNERAQPITRATPQEIAALVGAVEEKGVELWCEGGRLHYRAPQGALSPPEAERLRVMRDEVLALLHTRRVHQPIPLSFSQQARWNLYQAGELRSCRQLASATRLLGPLRPEVLQRSLAAVVHRQEALRTRIAVHQGVPVQEIDSPGELKLVVHDLSELPETARPEQIQRCFDACILEPFDLAQGPLFVAKLLVLSAREHVLLVALEHLIGDGFSLNILLRETFTAYTQVASGHPLSLPPLGMSFADYARQQRTAVTDDLADPGFEPLPACGRLRFPTVTPDGPALSGVGKVPLSIGQPLTAELRQWSRQHRTTLVLTLLSAYVAHVLRWCKVDEAVIQYEINGRRTPAVENTIGYFATQLYLKMQWCREDRFVDLLNRATQEYCRAYEESAFSSHAAARLPRPEFARNTLFNWVPHGRSDIADAPLFHGSDPIHCSTWELMNPALKTIDLDYEPSILLYETQEDIAGGIYFPHKRFSVASMQAFAGRFLNMTRALLTRADRPIRDLSID